MAHTVFTAVEACKLQRVGAVFCPSGRGESLWRQFRLWLRAAVPWWVGVGRLIGTLVRLVRDVLDTTVSQHKSDRVAKGAGAEQNRGEQQPTA